MRIHNIRVFVCNVRKFHLDRRFLILQKEKDICSAMDPQSQGKASLHIEVVVKDRM